MEEETKLCLNCKREIPAVNFTIHSVHCARNIRICPVCKEPVTHADLDDHHDKLHKLQPCEKCGESVCGTDMEDHIRDSCALTIKSCRFCELELPRRELPAHENYCGVRTEQCPECREWVMIKYRQLHIDSNHGFLRLDDDPAPAPKREVPKPSSVLNPVIAKVANLPSTSNVLRPSTSSNKPNGLTSNVPEKPRTEMRYFGSSSTASASGEGSRVNIEETALRRTNGQPQNNINVASINKVDKNSSISRGAVKKRPAPKPPVRSPPALERRDLPYYSALQRHQKEEQQRQQQNAYNLAHGLPPVLSPAAKLEKLRKMDALQNPDTSVDYKSKLQGRVWKSPEHVVAGHVLGSDKDRRQDLEDLKPMTPQEFMQRFNELQLRRDGEERKKSSDRFSEIKSSLRELRRGLNEVTAPYNTNSNGGISYNNNNGNNERRSGRASPLNDEIRLPCEFCGELILDIDLVQHQTGCRPDLAQVRPRSSSPEAAVGRVPRRATHATHATHVAHVTHATDAPVIPCEFCAEPLPVYLISEHQERCGREANLLYPD